MIHRIVKLLITWYLVDFEAANEMAPLNLQVNLYQSRCAIGTHPYHCLYYTTCCSIIVTPKEIILYYNNAKSTNVSLYSAQYMAQNTHFSLIHPRLLCEMSPGLVILMGPNIYQGETI